MDGDGPDDDDDDEDGLWTPRREATPPTPPPAPRRWNLPALLCLHHGPGSLASASTLGLHWRFLCYCFAALPAVPRRPMNGDRHSTPAPEVFPLQTSAISLAGAARAAAVGGVALSLQPKSCCRRARWGSA